MVTAVDYSYPTNFLAMQRREALCFLHMAKGNVSELGILDDLKPGKKGHQTLPHRLAEGQTVLEGALSYSIGT